MILRRGPVSNALVVMLAAATGRPCGLGARPRTASGAEPEAPYLIVWPVDSSYSGPPLGDDSSDAAWSYQVTSVGLTVPQTEALADRVRVAMLDRASSGAYLHPLAATGVSVPLRVFDTEGPADTTDDTVSLPQVFTVHCTPA